MADVLDEQQPSVTPPPQQQQQQQQQQSAADQPPAASTPGGGGKVSNKAASAAFKSMFGQGSAGGGSAAKASSSKAGAGAAGTQPKQQPAAAASPAAVAGGGSGSGGPDAAPQQADAAAAAGGALRTQAQAAAAAAAAAAGGGRGDGDGDDVGDDDDADAVSDAGADSDADEDAAAAAAELATFKGAFKKEGSKAGGAKKGAKKGGGKAAANAEGVGTGALAAAKAALGVDVASLFAWRAGQPVPYAFLAETFQVTRVLSWRAVVVWWACCGAPPGRGGGHRDSGHGVAHAPVRRLRLPLPLPQQLSINGVRPYVYVCVQTIASTTKRLEIISCLTGVRASPGACCCAAWAAPERPARRSARACASHVCGAPARLRLHTCSSALAHHTHTHKHTHTHTHTRTHTHTHTRTRTHAGAFRAILASTPADLLPTVYLCTNRVAPAHEGVELGVGDATLIKVCAFARVHASQCVCACARRCVVCTCVSMCLCACLVWVRGACLSVCACVCARAVQRACSATRPPSMATHAHTHDTHATRRRWLPRRGARTRPSRPTMKRAGIWAAWRQPAGALPGVWCVGCWVRSVCLPVFLCGVVCPRRALATFVKIRRASAPSTHAPCRCRLCRASARSAQRTMFQPAPLTVASVFKTFKDIAK
jgi:hypothetical protein